MKSIKITLLCSVLALALAAPMAGCTPRVGGGDYSSSGAQRVYEVEFGTVVSVRQVAINDGNVNTAVGAVGGGVIGGILGNMMGAGKGNTLATLGGVLVGAAAGGLGGQAIGNQQGVEVTVQLDNGRTLAIVQGADMVFSPGQRVRVTQGDGKTRVSPF